MKPGDLVRHTMKSHSIYSGCVGLVIKTEKEIINGHSRAKIRWFGITNEFHNMIWLPIYVLVLVGRDDTNV